MSPDHMIILANQLIAYRYEQLTIFKLNFLWKNTDIQARNVKKFQNKWILFLLLKFCAGVKERIDNYFEDINAFN